MTTRARRSDGHRGGQRAGSKAPGKAGELAQKPFAKAKDAIGRSGSKGRRGRAKAPF